MNRQNPLIEYEHAPLSAPVRVLQVLPAMLRPLPVIQLQVLIHDADS